MMGVVSRRWGCLLLGGLALAAAQRVAAQSADCEPSFSGLPIFTVGPNGGTNALADLDDDGHLDLITGEFFFLGSGDGTFGISRRVTQHAALPIFDIVPRDFDLDGRLDLALGSFGGSSIYVAFGRKPETPEEDYFERVVEIPSVLMPWHIASADFNEDGLLDVVAVGLPGDVGEGMPIALNNGDRTFRGASHLAGELSPGHALTVGDFNGDSHMDILQGAGAESMLAFGNGDATFDAPLLATIRHELSPVGAHRFRSADLDLDGRSDVGVIGEDVVLIYLGCAFQRGEALPAEPSLALSLTGAGRFMEFADVNSDGFLDVVAQTNQGGRARVQVFYAEEITACSVTFSPGEAFTTTLDGHGSVLAVADVNGDLAPDVVLTTEGDGRGQVFLSDASCVQRQAERGDSNVDDRIDISDAVTTLGFLFMGRPIACRPAAEVTGDDRLDISDAIYLLQYLFNSGPPLQNPGPVDCHG